MTISTGTDGSFSAGDGTEWQSKEDMTAKNAGTTGDLTLNSVSGSGNVTISLWSAFGRTVWFGCHFGSIPGNLYLMVPIMVDRLTLGAGLLFVSGSMTVYLFTATLSGENAINVKGNVVIDASNAASAAINIHTGLRAGVTMSLGTGSTAAFVSALELTGLRLRLIRMRWRCGCY